jgi:hypothetical protein
MSPVPPDRQLAKAGFDTLPARIAGAGARAAWRFTEFFTVNIRNANTRRAYGCAVSDFFAWCSEHRIRDLAHISPTVVAAYVEQLQETHAKPSGQQHRDTDSIGGLRDRADRRARVLEMIRRRAAAAGIKTKIGCHTFRATGITTYLENGGTLEHAQQTCPPKAPCRRGIAAHHQALRPHHRPDYPRRDRADRDLT